MLKFVILVSFIISPTAFSQNYWDFSDIDNAKKQREYSKGLVLKSRRRHTLDTTLWDKSTTGNTETYTTIPYDKKMKNKILIDVTYDDIKKEKRKIKEIHQVTISKKNSKQERILTTTFDNEDPTDATECKRINGSQNYSCYSIDHHLCPRLKKAMNGSMLQSTAKQLKTCTDSLGKLNELLTSDKTLKDLKRTNSFQRTSKAMNGKIKHINGKAFGNEIAAINNVALNDVYELISLCEEKGLDKGRVKKSPVVNTLHVDKAQKE